MKTNILLFLFLAIPFLFFAQKDDEYKKYIKYYYKHIEWGDRQYDNSIRGIVLLLEDVEKVDAELHLMLNEEYEIFERNRRQANLITGIGVGTGLGFTLAAASQFELFSDNGNAGTYLIAGVIFTAGGLLIGKNKRPNERKFMYRFTNLFNENTQGEKVQYSVRPAINLSNNRSLGLSFSLKF